MSPPLSTHLSTRRIPLMDFDVRSHPSQPGWWKASAKFKVEMQLRAGSPDLLDYEYRQNIKGTATWLRGLWTNGIWLPVGAPESMASLFIIPPDPKTGTGRGLLNTWKEDGIIDAGVVRRYGYRNSRMRDGPHLLDNYTTPHSYWAVDSPGIEAEMVDGMRLDFQFSFVGACYNVRDKKTYFFTDWHYKRTRTLRRRDDGTWSIT